GRGTPGELGGPGARAARLRRADAGREAAQAGEGAGEAGRQRRGAGRPRAGLERVPGLAARRPHVVHRAGQGGRRVFAVPGQTRQGHRDPALAGDAGLVPFAARGGQARRGESLTVHRTSKYSSSGRSAGTPNTIVRTPSGLHRRWGVYGSMTTTVPGSTSITSPFNSILPRPSRM